MAIRHLSVVNISHSHPTADVTGLDEQVRDVIGAALVAGSNVTITVDIAVS